MEPDPDRRFRPRILEDNGPNLCDEGKRFLARWADEDEELRTILPALPPALPGSVRGPEFYKHWLTTCTDCRARKYGDDHERPTWNYIKSYL